MNKTKLMIISHAFVVEVNQKRWRFLAENYNYDVHIITPGKWISKWFGDVTEYTPKKVDEENFHVHPMPTTSKSKWTKYFYRSLDCKMREIQPDLIYLVHEEMLFIHHQIYRCRNFFAKKAKIIFFSMNGMGVPLKTFVHRWMWRDIKQNTEAALVHYPGCKDSLRSAGYKNPIYLQTQVGVDEEIFCPNIDLRDKFRSDLGWQDKFIIGFSGRIGNDKGVDTILKALPIENINWALLLVGDGPMVEDVKNWSKKNGWEKQVHITGFVPQDKVPGYMNAMDCLVLASKTTAHWLDTFPLVTVQAQACGVPVIGSNSASIPWQLADSAIIFPENDKDQLKKELSTMAKDEKKRYSMAKKGIKRSREFFCIKGMSANFDKIAQQVLSSNYVFHEKNEKYTQWKAVN